MHFKFNDAEIKFLDDSLKKIYVEITNACNLNCKMCFRRYWNEEIGFMDEKLFLKLIEDINKIETVETFHFGGIGEPLVHPDFLKFLNMLDKKEIMVSTNGTLMNEKLAEIFVKKGVKKVTISFDSPSEEIFLNIRGISKNIVYRNIKRLSELKKRYGSDYPEIEIEFLAMKSNINTLTKIPDIADEMGVSKILVSNLIPLDSSQKDEILYDGSIDKLIIDEFLKKAFTYRMEVSLAEFELKTERTCDFMERRSTVISWKGDVVPCYRFLHSYTEYIFGRKKDVHFFSFGNIRERSLIDIWRDLQYRKFRWIVKSSIYPSCIDCVFASKSCNFVLNTDLDCEGNTPSCGDCLWSRRIALCP